MIPYTDLNEQVDADFTRARRCARLRAVVARIRREHTSTRLLSFDDVRRELAANNRRPRGTRVVETVEAAVAEFHPERPTAPVPATSKSELTA